MSKKKPRSQWKRMGRPPKAPKDLKTEEINVRMTKAERKRLQAKADRLGISVSALLMQPWRKPEQGKE